VRVHNAASPPGFGPAPDAAQPENHPTHLLAAHHAERPAHALGLERLELDRALEHQLPAVEPADADPAAHHHRLFLFLLVLVLVRPLSSTPLRPVVRARRARGVHAVRREELVLDAVGGERGDDDRLERVGRERGVEPRPGGDVALAGGGLGLCARTSGGTVDVCFSVAGGGGKEAERGREIGFVRTRVAGTIERRCARIASGSA
jgi:hypothetical protein